MWTDIDPTLRVIAERVCTPKELDALKLIAGGGSIRGGARALGIATTTFRDRLERAERKVLSEFEKQAKPADDDGWLVGDDKTAA